MGATMDSKSLRILECTLRDGSYTIDFQFTARDTTIIAAALENVGFDLIEVGHGLGLNASNAGKGVAAATDEEYLQAAASTLKHAEWGMFFIPGIGRHEDLELAAGYGMNFVRIGTNAPEVEESKEYVEHAKNLGLFVSANLMKSYALPPKELAEKARLSQEYGVDVVCLVDSAGTMFPEHIRTYMGAMQDVLKVPLGLHCHDNLSLGIANVLAAIDCGAQRIDSTLQGMGRGGGNPVTEVLVSVLKKRGLDLGIDLHRLMDISDRLVKPLLQDKGWDSIDITSGFAGFHSSHLKTILKYADQYGVDPRDLIVGVCEVDQVNAPQELVEGVARQLGQRQRGRSGLHIVPLPRFAYPSGEAEETPHESLAAAARKVAKEARTAAKKTGRRSVFNVVAASRPTGKATVSRFVQEEFDCVISSVEVDNPEQLEEVIAAVDGIVDVMLVDSERKGYLDRSLDGMAAACARRSLVLAYKDNDVWVRSVDQRIGAMLQSVRGRRITVCGTDSMALKLALSLLEQGAEVTLTQDEPEHLEACARTLRQMAVGSISLRLEEDPIDAARGVDVLVKFTHQPPLVSPPMVEVLSPGAIVFDAGIGSVSPEAIPYGNKRGVRIVRPDMRPALAAELASVLGARRIVRQIMGRGEVAGVPVLAGGLVGQYGEIVVDSVSNPSRIVGVADGRGRMIHESRPEFAGDLVKVEREILRKQIVVE